MRYFLSLLLIVLVFGCRNYSPENLPKGLVADSIFPEKQMILIMTDVHILEAALQMERNKGKEIKPLQDYYFNQLFSRYKTTSSRFRKNILYYQGDPDKFKKMYDEVVANLDSLKKGVKP